MKFISRFLSAKNVRVRDGDWERLVFASVRVLINPMDCVHCHAMKKKINK